MRDLEGVHALECMVTKPTRITDATETLLDVILTNRFDLRIENYINVSEPYRLGKTPY